MESLADWFRGLWQEVAGHDRASRREVLVLSYVHGVAQGEPTLGFIARSWVDRGPGYWARRISVTLLYLLIGLVLGFATLGFAPYVLFSNRYAIHAQLPLVARVLILILWNLPAIPAYLAMYRRLTLYGYQRNRLQGSPHIGFLTGRFTILLAVPFFPMLGGLVLAMGTATLRLQFPGESAAHEARQLYQLYQQQARDSTSARRRKASGKGGGKKR
ncbi:hypothetical protein [Actinospica sp.]|uniref:hypothetical protein n=1 Tax=Actinospica sp. TaxID=1872142 RepID=UPI002CD89218|nr:hypothetical protein [Actinospica sp.]HWG22710.1 hypothetical protein [Actinospica sp.]